MRLVSAGAWTAGALALGWLATAGSFAFQGGHPPMWYVVGGCVVLASFVLAPIGAAAALAGLWQARRQDVPAPRRATAALVLNLLLLAAAVTLWFWFDWLASRR